MYMPAFATASGDDAGFGGEDLVDDARGSSDDDNECHTPNE